MRRVAQVRKESAGRLAPPTPRRQQQQPAPARIIRPLHRFTSRKARGAASAALERAQAGGHTRPGWLSAESLCAKAAARYCRRSRPDPRRGDRSACATASRPRARDRAARSVTSRCRPHAPARSRSRPGNVATYARLLVRSRRRGKNCGRCGTDAGVVHAVADFSTADRGRRGWRPLIAQQRDDAFRHRPVPPSPALPGEDARPASSGSSRSISQAFRSSTSSTQDRPRGHATIHPALRPRRSSSPDHSRPRPSRSAPARHAPRRAPSRLGQYIHIASLGSQNLSHSVQRLIPSRRLVVSSLCNSSRRHEYSRVPRARIRKIERQRRQTFPSDKLDSTDRSADRVPTTGRDYDFHCRHTTVCPEHSTFATACPSLSPADSVEYHAHRHATAWRR